MNRLDEIRERVNGIVNIRGNDICYLLDLLERAEKTLEHIAKGRCSNPKQCAQECLDGDVSPDYFAQTEQPKVNYLIMDGRARFDRDRAIVVSVCGSLEEAKREMRECYLGYDYVVLYGGEVVYDPMVEKR